MANSTMSGAALEFARSIEVASIPEKLRCAQCDKVAINAVRLPCCDSSICGDCKDIMTATECPVCTHSPFSADTATTAKALRTTVNVFLKTEAKKRGMDIKGDTLKPIAAAEPTPVAETPAVEAAPIPAPAGEAEPSVAPAEVEEPAADGEATPVVAPEAGVEDITVNGDAVDLFAKITDPEQDDEDESDDDDVVITTERPEGEELDQQQQQEQEQEQEQYDEQANNGGNSKQNMDMDMNQQQGFGGFDQNMAGFNNSNFGNMGMNGFNPMMGMMGMGMPNMMGMPGMGMDPSMMFNGGFGGMGDMSAMMGMNGMNGMGMGGDMSGMGNFGGMNGPGFFPNQGNYMQSQNFGNAPRQNFFNDRGYGGRGGRGFGRGARGSQYGRGRGGYGFQQQQYGGQNPDVPLNAPTGPSGARSQLQQQQSSGSNTVDLASRRRASPTYDAVQGSNGTLTESAEKSHDQATNGDQDAPKDTNIAEGDTNATDDNLDQPRLNGNSTGQDAQGENTSAHDSEHADLSVVTDATQVGADQAEDQHVDGNRVAMGVNGNTVESAVVAEPSYGNVDESAQIEQQNHSNFSGRGGLRGRGGYGYGGYQGRGTDSTELTPKPAPPVNAPTGPKALRQGLPNTGWVSRASLQKPAPTPVPQRSGSELRSTEQSRYDAPVDHDNGTRDRSASRSGSKHRSRDGRDRDGEDEYEDDETYARRKERKRRERKDRERKYEEDDREEESSSRKHRSRSESRTDDGSRRRHRDKEDEHRSSRSHRDKSKDRHRSRRHRSKSPAKEYEEDYDSRRKSKRDDKYDDYKESRSNRKSSRREDDYKHEDSSKTKDRSSRSSRHERPPRDEDYKSERDRPRPGVQPVPVSEEIGFKIKGSTKLKPKPKMEPPAPASSSRSFRRGSAVTEPAASADPYAEERARAQQDREAKEAQRRQSTQETSTRSSLGKRGRDHEDDGGGVPTGPKGDRNRHVQKKGRKERRTISYKYEDEVEMH